MTERNRSEYQHEYHIKRKAKRDEERAARLIKLEGEQPGLVAMALEQKIDPLRITHGWNKTENWSVFFKNYVPGDDATYETLSERIADLMSSHAPNYEAFQYKPQFEKHLFVYDPADLHINKLAIAYETGEDYNSQIAVQRCRAGLSGLLNKAFGYSFDEILFVLGNDMLNSDGPQNSTTKGTRQDVHILWTEAFLMGYEIFVEQIETCAKIAPTIVKFNPSNHDVMAGWYLAQMLRIHFRNHPNVTFDCSTAHRKYYRYHKNLIGLTHGDGAKAAKLPGLMSYEAKAEWSLCDHFYWYTHHIHHKESKDFGNVTVESMRSPSSPDGWHSRNGFVGSPKAIEGFVHHPLHGQVARFTEIFY